MKKYLKAVMRILKKKTILKQCIKEVRRMEKHKSPNLFRALTTYYFQAKIEEKRKVEQKKIIS